MQISVSPVKYDGDLITAAVLRFGVQRLVDVANEMKNPSKRLTASPVIKAKVVYALGLIDQSAHGAALYRETIASEIQSTLPGRVILGVNIVPCSKVRKAGDVADFVRPKSGFGNVLVIDQLRDVGGGLRGEVLGCQIRDCSVAEGAPAGSKLVEW